MHNKGKSMELTRKIKLFELNTCKSNSKFDQTES
jgi:hypothetical protein